jgi:thiamine-phosphate pyrophosphorylase
MNPKEARKILGNNFIIGGSSNTMDDVKWLMANGVDYLGIGPFRFTTTREKLNPILGLEGIQKIAKEFGSKIPMIAIGGIKLSDVESVIQTGIYGVAVSSGINMAEDKSEMTKKFISSLKIKQPSISSTSCG